MSAQLKQMVKSQIVVQNELKTSNEEARILRQQISSFEKADRDKKASTEQMIKEQLKMFDEKMKEECDRYERQLKELREHNNELIDQLEAQSRLQ